MTRLLIPGIALAVLLGAAMLLFGGRDGPLEENDLNRQQVVYVCTETGRPFVMPVAQVPAKHPETGRNTLMPGLYCAQCRAWYPGPPFDVGQRNPNSLLCPKHRVPMVPRGPLP